MSAEDHAPAGGRKPPGGDAAFRRRRSGARLAAVQALYQMEIGDVGAEAVVREFLDHRLADEVAAGEVDDGYFVAIVKGVVADQGQIDRAVDAVLSQGWRLSRLAATARAILRAGGWELLHRPDTPVSAVLAGYVDVADAFFDGPEPRFVNAALDAIAGSARREEAPAAP